MKPTNLSQADLSRPDVRRRLQRASSIGLRLRVGAILVLAGLLASSFYSASSASQSGQANKNWSAQVAQSAAATLPRSLKLAERLEPVSRERFSPAFLPVPPPAGPTVETFAAGCTTPQTSFAVGDGICVKVTGFPTGSFFPRRLVLGNANSTVIQSFDVTMDPQTFEFTIDATSVIGGLTVDNRGSWQAVVFNPFFYYPEGASAFTVADPANLTAELAVATTGGPGGVPADSAITFMLEVKNYGPDSAAAVQLTDAVPANTTFVDFHQVSGPAFTCTNPSVGSTGTTSCTLASLVWPGPAAEFAATYQINMGTPVNTQIVNTADLVSTTNDQNPANNSTSETATIVATTGTACSFNCPANIVATATSPSGAIVTFASAININGDCGSIAATPSSGSQFPVGVTTVNVISSGPSCSFTVTVVDTPAPTISCPADRIATADNTGFATVSVGAPTTSPSTGVTVVGRRSDDTPAVYDENGILVSPEVIVPLTDPYPTGTTGITWTVTDSYGRTATCTQRIVVHSPCATDTEAPVIVACGPLGAQTGTACAVTANTGPNSTTCGVALSPSDDDLGTPAVSDDCSATVTISGLPPGNLFPVGNTTLTYTATDGAGHTASATQLVTVVDNTPPVIVAPADASYVCPSEVPAASPSQAHGNDPGLPNGGPVTDNCGSATVTVSDSSTGAGSAASPLIITRTYTATDSHGNSANAVQMITVIDNTPPTITAPANASYQCASSVPAANASQASASDNCGSPTVTVSQTSNGGVGSTASPLVLTRTYTATDAAGNSTNAAQTITVIDNTPPTITAPANAGYQCPSQVPAANASQATASDNCVTPTVTVSQTTNGGIGSTASPLVITRTFTATDAANNSASAVQTITVIDNTPPVITCAADIVADFNPAVNGAVVTYTAPVGSDNCSGATTIQTAGLASGSTFPTGTTTNTFRVTDAAGNTASCSFKVTVALTSLIGLDSVNITGSGYADSYSSVGGYPATKGSLANILSNGTITIGGSGKVWGNVRSTRVGVNLTGTAQVTGNATAGTTVSKAASAIVGGTITNNALAPERPPRRSPRHRRRSSWRAEVPQAQRARRAPAGGHRGEPAARAGPVA